MTKPLSEDLRSLVLTDDWKSPIPHSSNLKDEIHFKWSLEAAQQLEHVLSMELSILLNQSYPPPCQTWSWRCPLEPPPGMKEKFKDILQSRRIVYSEQRYLSYSLLKSFLQVFPPPVSAGLNCFFFALFPLSVLNLMQLYFLLTLLLRTILQWHRIKNSTNWAEIPQN